MTDSPYKMQLDLRVLDHLGLHLYSNAAAVLSEAVANAWDADARNVTITIEEDRIVIEDDGVGMNLDDINSRFLNVGYDKRSTEGDKAVSGRAFMGRKGIGKLALFSIADAVTVSTRKDSEHHSFLMETSGIEAAASNREEYKPVPTTDLPPSKGTQIVLTMLKKKRTGHTVNALRKRIARRFSIIGYTSATGDSFNVIVNGISIGADDRDDQRAVEFLWELSETPLMPDEHFPSLRKRFQLSNVVDEAQPTWLVSGWFGAASKPTSLSTDDSGLMNSFVVIARGRLIQENILDKLGFNMLFGHYLTGQIEADFLDVKDEEDIATSDRQRLMEDDPRYLALRDFLRKTLVSIAETWITLRNEIRGEEAIKNKPPLREWIEGLPAGQQKAARRTLGVISSVALDNEGDRKVLFESGILAFERLRLQEASHQLGELDSLTVENLLPLLIDLSTLEGSMYREIVVSRLNVISKFKNLVDANEKEKILQQYLFENLWLLDAGWEKAAGSERIEQTLKKDYPDFNPLLSEEESKGRVDIRYMTNAGEHMIVELKRAGRKLRISELIEQGTKYRTALSKCLEIRGQDQPLISIVFVLGTPVTEDKDKYLPVHYVRDTLGNLGARVVYYDQLIRSAEDGYSEYLEGSEKLGRINELLSRLD